MSVLDSPVVPVRPTILRQARNRVGLSLAEAGNLLRGQLGESPEASADLLASWERGIKPLTLEAAEVLANIYFLRFPALFQAKLPADPIRDFRSATTRPRALSYESHRALRLFDDYYAATQRVLRALGEAESVSLPRLRPADFGDADPEALAGTVRALLELDDDVQLLWRTQEAACRDMVARVEASGVFVFHLGLPLGEVRGASRWEASGPPCILINSRDAGTAQLFTLVHEYVHLLLRDLQQDLAVCDPSDQQALGKNGATEERFVNRVAAAVLVPASLLDLALPSRVPSGPLESWPKELQGQLQRVFHVSREVIGIRLFHLDRAGAPTWRRIWRQPSAEPFGRSRPGSEKLRLSLGAKATALLARAVQSEVASPAELSRMLGAKVSDVATVLGAG